MLSSRPLYRVYDMLDEKWSDWEKRFAWYPRRLPFAEEHETHVAGMTVNHRVEGHRWIWMKHYYRRHRMHNLGMTAAGGIVYQEDYAFDLFDIMRKAE